MERPEYIMFFREVFEHPDCSKVDAEVYGYVYWFTKLRNEKCTASNETLAQLVGTTPQTISNSLTTLEKTGFIKRIFKDASKSERLEIVALLHVTRRGSPTDVPMVHLQVKGGTPTGEQSESIELEHIFTANAVRDSHESNSALPMRIVTNSETERRGKEKAVPPEIRQVFNIFTGSPSHIYWGEKNGMSKYAQMMLNMYPIEKLRLMYQLLKKDEKEIDTPVTVDSPKDFIDKLPKIKRQLNRR